LRLDLKDLRLDLRLARNDLSFDLRLAPKDLRLAYISDVWCQKLESLVKNG